MQHKVPVVRDKCPQERSIVVRRLFTGLGRSISTSLCLGRGYLWMTFIFHLLRDKGQRVDSNHRPSMGISSRDDPYGDARTL